MVETVGSLLHDTWGIDSFIGGIKFGDFLAFALARAKKFLLILIL